MPEARESPDRGGEVAGHLLAAAPDVPELRSAAHWAEAAATAATSALAFEDAARYLATAVTAAQRAGTDDPRQARLLVELATAEYRAGQLGASLQHAEAAADVADRGGQPELAAAAALVVRGIGHPDVASTLLQLSDRALAAGDRCPDAARARLLAQRASAAPRRATAARHARHRAGPDVRAAAGRVPRPGLADRCGVPVREYTFRSTTRSARSRSSPRPPGCR